MWCERHNKSQVGEEDPLPGRGGDEGKRKGRAGRPGVKTPASGLEIPSSRGMALEEGQGAGRRYGDGARSRGWGRGGRREGEIRGTGFGRVSIFNVICPKKLFKGLNPQKTQIHSIQKKKIECKYHRNTTSVEPRGFGSSGPRSIFLITLPSTDITKTLWGRHGTPRETPREHFASTTKHTRHGERRG